MSEEIKTKAQKLCEELEALEAALQIAAGGTAPEVQEIVNRMKDLLAPAA